MRWLFDRFLWRIRTKLILSYLFIALVPVVLLGIFFTTAATFFLMLSASRLVRAQVERSEDLARATASAALVDLPQAEPAAAGSLRERLAPLLALQPKAAWTLLRRGRVIAAEGAAPRELPSWWTGTPFAGLVRLDDSRQRGPVPAALRVVAARGEAVLLVDLPVDERLFADLERRVGIHVLQLDEMQVESGARPPRWPARRARHRRGVRRGRPAGAPVADLGARLRLAGLPGEDQLGDGREERLAVPAGRSPSATSRWTIVRRLSPASLRELGMHTMPEFLLYLLGILGAAFVGMYGFALVLGLLLARQITRGVHDLTVGTERLRQGDFSHVIRIRSHDQLGDLAESFNLMSRSLQALILEQSERQRLEEELRIARQIQMSLLPGRAWSVCRASASRRCACRPPRLAGTTTISCRSARAGWGCWWRTCRARARRPRSTWRS